MSNTNLNNKEFTEDKFMAYLELSQDLLIDKIPTDQINYYLKESLSIGKSLAKTLKSENLRSIVDHNNIEVIVKEDKASLFNIKLRAQVEYDPKGDHKIYIYEESLKEYAKVCGITTEEAIDVHLAHELFHFFEFVNGEVVSDTLDSILLSSFLGIKRYSGILRTSEIAAHAFAKELLQLEYLPNYYDYQYLIKNGRYSEEDLKRRREEFDQLQNS